MLDTYDISAMCHGDAKGADTLAKLYAAKRGIDCTPFPADWKGPCGELCSPGHRHAAVGGTGDYCPAAGAYRNQRMLTEFKPDIVVAFPGGTGTQDMCKRAAAAGVKVVAVT